MACFFPLRAYRSTERNPDTGKYGITFNPHHALVERSPLILPCSKCIGCKLDRTKQWAIRCVHELRTAGSGCFITLTYDDQHVPVDYSVNLRDLQLFFKRLRKHLRKAHPGLKIKFFACGEYGTQFGRPHYHACITGFDFPDRTFYRSNDQGDRMYKSELLAELWPAGLHEISDLTFKSAAYTARYVTQVISGDTEVVSQHYSRVSPIDGNTYNVKPEFATMSKKPGLGAEWFQRFKGDAFSFSDIVNQDGEVVGRRPSGDFLVVDNHKVKPPSYYLRQLSEADALLVQRERKRHSIQPKVKANNTPERLNVRKQVQEAKAKRLSRKLA